MSEGFISMEDHAKLIEAERKRIKELESNCDVIKMSELIERHSKLEKELAEARQETNDSDAFVLMLTKEKLALESRLSEAVLALKQYADKRVWDGGGWEGENAKVIFCRPAKEPKPGYSIAEECLRKIEERK